MYKTFSRWMQAAAWGWNAQHEKPKPIIRSPRRKITADELREFNTVRMPMNVLLDQLRPVIKDLRRDGTKPSPGQLAKLLNAKGWKTAQGRQWDERRVVLLLWLMAEQSARQRSLKAKAAPKPKPVKGSPQPM
jgi:hypothetical protein